MSEENLAIVRRIHELWGSEESVRDLLAEGLEYVNPPYAVEPGTRVGGRMFGVVRETYPDFRFHVERYVDTDGDDVVVLGRYTASGPTSGIALEGEQGYVWTIRDGLAVQLKLVGLNPGDALAAQMGLEWVAAELAAVNATAEERRPQGRAAGATARIDGRGVRPWRREGGYSPCWRYSIACQNEPKTPRSPRPRRCTPRRPGVRWQPIPSSLSAL